MKNRQRSLWLTSTIIAATLFVSGCSAAFLDELSEYGSDVDYSTRFYGTVVRVRPVYYVGRSQAVNSTILGGLLGGTAGALISNSGAGTLIGAGAGAAIGAAASQDRLNDADFSEEHRGHRVNRIVVRRDNGDRVVLVQPYARDLIRGDRVRVTLFSDGSVRIKRVRDY